MHIRIYACNNERSLFFIKYLNLSAGTHVRHNGESNFNAELSNATEPEIIFKNLNEIYKP